MTTAGKRGGSEELGPATLARQLLEALGTLRERRLCVAFSGGLDSSVLLVALARLRRSWRLRLRALHVNHHLHPESGSWAQAAARQARRLRVPCELIEAPVKRAAGESLEAAARAARYAALAAHLQPGEVLLTAHHQEDQLETVLLALLRGSGVRGLAAMGPVSRWSGTLLVRPLLPFSRTQLERFARAAALVWSEDPSNIDERFDRNYLRRRVLPLIRQRWPAAAATASRSAAHLAEARDLLEQQARAQLAAARDGATLRVSVLSRLSPPQRRNALRSWIGERGLPVPDHRRLREIAGSMLAARQDALPSVRWRGGEVRRHADRLFATGGSATLTESLWWDWSDQPSVVLADGSTLGLLPDEYGDVHLPALPRRLHVSFRQGGERLRVSARRGGEPARVDVPPDDERPDGERQQGTPQGHHVALKDLLQAQGLAPWERRQVPLIGDGEHIIAVADFWLSPAYRAGTHAHAAERGRFRWRRQAI